jgi:hypothetical protein
MLLTIKTDSFLTQCYKTEMLKEDSLLSVENKMNVYITCRLMLVGSATVQVVSRRKLADAARI